MGGITYNCENCSLCDHKTSRKQSLKHHIQLKHDGISSVKLKTVKRDVDKGVKKPNDDKNEINKRNTEDSKQKVDKNDKNKAPTLVPKKYPQEPKPQPEHREASKLKLIHEYFAQVKPVLPVGLVDGAGRKRGFRNFPYGWRR